MEILIKDLETKTEQTLEVVDIMLCVTQGDNKTVLFLLDGTRKELHPADRYLVCAVPVNEPPPEVPTLTLDELKAVKLAELSQVCNSTITAGCDVTLSDGTMGHISMKDEDQINLMSAIGDVQSGASGAPYHLDGTLCRIYPAADIGIIAAAAKQHKLYHTTYCNHLNEWVRRCETAEAVQAITYGSALPDDLAANLAEVLGNGK